MRVCITAQSNFIAISPRSFPATGHGKQLQRRRKDAFFLPQIALLRLHSVVHPFLCDTHPRPLTSFSRSDGQGSIRFPKNPLDYIQTKKYGKELKRNAKVAYT